MDGYPNFVLGLPLSSILWTCFFVLIAVVIAAAWRYPKCMGCKGEGVIDYKPEFLRQTHSMRCPDCFGSKTLLSALVKDDLFRTLVHGTLTVLSILTAVGCLLSISENTQVSYDIAVSQAKQINGVKFVVKSVFPTGRYGSMGVVTMPQGIEVFTFSKTNGGLFAELNEGDCVIPMLKLPLEEPGIFREKITYRHLVTWSKCQ